MSFITTLSRMAFVLGAILMAMTGLLLTYEVIARYYFVKPTIWAAELSQLCLIWGCLLAMAHLLHVRRHITVNAVTNLLSETGQRICAGFALLAVIGFSVIVGLWGFEIFFDSFERGRTTGSLLDLPSWVSELSVPVGFALLTAQAMVELVTLRSTDRVALGSSQE